MSQREPRIGLALSGGGFRAAFFHVGVLEQLEKLDLLRHVRMLSCVSGGSIAGAAYYLSLFKSLMLGNEIEPGMVPPLQEELLAPPAYAACVEQTRNVLEELAAANVRSAMLRNLWKNVVMFVSPAYSRTDRAGDMLDVKLREGFNIDTGYRYPFVARQLQLRSLLADRPDLPRLVLNATTLNTGHNWRFEPAGMGETMPLPRRFVDKNDLLVWRPFSMMPEQQQDFPLGFAVVASAAFPGLFRPLPVSGLYGRRVDLMDGGAQDNQGVQALVEAHLADPDEPLFDRIIVSDGSGQLKDEGTKRRSAVAVGRIIGIQGDRIREEQLLAARSRVETSGAQFDLLDLRHGLPYADVPAAGGPPVPGGGAPSRVREYLAQIRTDLDAFGALEMSLLRLRGREVAATVLGGPTVPIPEVTPFTRRDELLSAAGSQLSKPLRVYSADVFVLGLIVGALAVVAAWSVRFVRSDPDWRLLVVPLVSVVFLLSPALVSRVLLKLANQFGVPREGRWFAGVVVYVGLLVAAWRFGSRVVEVGNVTWSDRQAAFAAALLLAVPPVLPAVLALLWWLEGLWWKRLARAPAG